MNFALINGILAALKNLSASWVTSGRFGKNRFEWTANKLLKGAGADADPTEVDSPEVHGAAQHTNVTREVFLPACAGHIQAGSSSYGRGSMVMGGANDDEPLVNFTIKVPDDFVSFSSVQAVWATMADAGNMWWRLRAAYGAAGEATSTHSELPDRGATANAGSFTFNVQEPVNPLSLSDLARGDYLGIEFDRKGADPEDTLNDFAFLYGLLFTYVAEQ